jgi:nicotinamide mononucleotide adenylyltransferase
MKKLRYGKNDKKKVLTPYEQMQENMKNGVLIEEYTNLAENVTTEKEARDLIQKAWGVKSVNPNVFKVVTEILEKREIIKGGA